MKKILHILCAALLTISMFHFQVFQPSEARANTYVKDAIFAALKWMPVGYGRDGQQLRNNALFPWQRGSEEIWGNRQYFMPFNSAIGNHNQPPPCYYFCLSGAVFSIILPATLPHMTVTKNPTGTYQGQNNEHFHAMIITEAIPAKTPKRAPFSSQRG